MVRGNVQAISTSIEPSSFFVTDGVEVDDTEMSIHGKWSVLERLVMGGERGLRRKCSVSLAKWRSGGPVSFRPLISHFSEAKFMSGLENLTLMKTVTTGSLVPIPSRRPWENHR